MAYDPERDRYAVVFARDDDIPGEREIFLQIVSGDGVRANLNPALPAAADQLSTVGDDTAAFKAARPDVAYRPDLDGAGAGDAWIVACDGDDTTDEVFNVFARRVPAQTAGPLFCLIFPPCEEPVSTMGATGDGTDPSVAVVPGGEDFVVAWEGTTTGTDPEVFARRMAATTGAVGGQTAVTANADDFTLADPSLTANTAINELLVAYRSASAENGSEGTEVNVQRLDLGLGQVGTNDQQVSSAGGPGSGGLFATAAPAAAYARRPPAVPRDLGRQRHRPSGPLRRRAGGPGDGPGRGGQRGRAAGLRRSPASASTTTRTSCRWRRRPRPTRRQAAGCRSGGADGPPMADNHFEEFGRQVGENFDVDGDGALVPADCNDANAGIRPGAAEVFDNGVDEDCSGADLENPDRDGDGSARPADCNDANAAIRPGAARSPTTASTRTARTGRGGRAWPRASSGSSRSSRGSRG